MRTKQVNFYFTSVLILLFLISDLSVFAKAQESIKRRETSQSYNVSQSDKLQVDNRFGNITITHWSKNEVSIRVVIECKAPSDDRAQANLDRIQIETKREGDIISAITTIKERNGNFNNESMTINYYIQMPSKLAADLSQKYGNINLPSDNNGKLDIHVKYGNLNGGDFTANTTIEAKYGNIEVGNLQDAQLDLGYVGSANIKNGKHLNIDSKYSNLKINSIESLKMTLKYGNFTIESAETVNLEIKYSDATIGTLKRSLKVDELGYGNLRINNLSPSFERIDVASHYGNLDVRVPAKTAFRVVAEGMKYSSCDVNGFNVTRKNSDDEEKSHTYEINGGSQRTIHFEGNRYGNLKVRAN